AVDHVTPNAAQQPNVVVRIDEQPQVETTPQLWYRKKQNAFDHHHVAGRHGDGFSATRVGGEVVLWAFHAAALAQFVQVAGEQRVVQSRWLVVVDGLALFGRVAGAIEV